MGYTDHDPITGDPLPVINVTTGERLAADGYGAIDTDRLVWAPRVNWRDFADEDEKNAR